MTKILFKEYGIDKCFITLFEEYPCNNKLELSQRESHWIRIFKKDPNCVN